MSNGNMVLDNYFRTNEEKDFISNFHKLKESIVKYKSGDINEFKWIILFMFMTIQSIFILILKGTNYIILEKCSVNSPGVKYSLNYYMEGDLDVKVDIIEGKKNVTINGCAGLDSFDKIITELKIHNINLTKKELTSLYNKMKKIISFDDMFKLICKTPPAFFTQGYTRKKLEKDKYVKFLNFLKNSRNTFIHFLPKSWMILLGGEGEYILLGLNLIEDLLGHKHSEIKNDISGLKTLFGIE